MQECCIRLQLIVCSKMKYACPFSSVPSSESTQKKRKRGDSGGRVDSEEVAEKKKTKRESQRPNYFISIPITNTEVKKKKNAVFL